MLRKCSLRHSVSACSRKTLALYSSSYASTGGQHHIHSTSCQHHSHQTMHQPVVSTAFIQPAVSTTVIQLRDNQWSALHSFNRRSAPHSPSYASTSGQASQSFKRQSAPHSSSGQLPSVYNAHRTSDLQQLTAELSPKHTGSVVNEHNLPTVLSSTADSSTSHTHTWYHHLHTPQPATPTHGITISTLPNQLTTHRHAVSPSPHSPTS